MTLDPDETGFSGKGTGERPNDDFRRELVTKLPNLRRFALTLTRSRYEAEGLVQASCERALARWFQYVPHTRMDNWLFSIMHSIWKNRLRRANNQRLAHDELARSVRHTDGEREVFGKIELSEVLSALQQLSADQAAAITLVSLEGLSYREAAAILEIPQGTLESRIARGRIALGRVLEGDQVVAVASQNSNRKSRGAS